MSSAYIIADIDVHRPDAYEAYKKLSSAAMQAHGAEVCVRGGPAETLEGSWQPKRMVLLKFPSLAAARRFHDSAEYQKAKAAREGIATLSMVLLEGV